MTTTLKKMKKTIVLAGKPAAGKGTQCEMLVERYGMVHISTGDMLRDRAQFMPEVKKLIESGQLVSDELIVSLLVARLQERDVKENGVIIDGFPRTLPQAKALAEHVKVDHFVFIDVADEVVMERIGGRRLDPITRRVYHLKFNPPPEDIKHRLVSRADDTPEKIKERLVSFNKHIEQLVALYGQVQSTIQGDKPGEGTPELIFENIKRALEGDEYWGRLIKTKVTVQSFECGSRARSLVSVARYCEHATWSMLKLGCLSDIPTMHQVHFENPDMVDSGVVAVASQVKLTRGLHLFEHLVLECWLARVGVKVVQLGFNVHSTRRKPDVRHSLPYQVDNEELDGLIATGFVTLAFLSPRDGRALPTPRYKYLSELAFNNHPPNGRVEFAEAKDVPKWSMDFVITEIALDSQGHVNTITWLRYIEEARYLASRREVTPPNVKADPGFALDSALCALPVSEARMHFSERASAGTRVRLEMWRLPEDRASFAVQVRRLQDLFPAETLLLAEVKVEVRSHL